MKNLILPFTLSDLIEMQRHSDFMETLTGNKVELITFASSLPDVETVARALSLDGLEILKDAGIEFQIYRQKKSAVKIDDGLSRTYENADGSGNALQFCELVTELQEIQRRIYSKILPLAGNLKVSSLDTETIETAAENINYFLDNLEVSYRDTRF